MKAATSIPDVIELLYPLIPSAEPVCFLRKQAVIDAIDNKILQMWDEKRTDIANVLMDLKDELG